MRKTIHILLVILVVLLIQEAPAMSQIHITSPLPGDILPAGKPVTISWQGSRGMPADISFSSDNGLSWVIIASGIADSSYEWTIPASGIKNIRFMVALSEFVPPRLLWEIKDAHSGEVRSSFISPDSKYLISTGSDSKLVLRDMQTRLGTDLLVMPGSNFYQAVFFHNEDSILVAADSSAIFLDRKKSVTRRFGRNVFRNIVRAIAVHPSESRFVAASYDGTACLFDLDNDKPLKAIMPPDSDAFYSARFSPDGLHLLLTGYNGKIYIYNYPSLILKQTCSGHGQNNQNKLVWSADFSPSSNFIVSGGVDNTVRIWNNTDGQQKYLFDSHKFHVRSARFHPGGRLVLSGSLDSTLRQWDALSGLEYKGAVINHGGQVLCADYSPGGDSLISSGRDRAIRLWKNFSYNSDTATVYCRVSQPLTVRIPHLHSRIGSLIKVPLILDKDSLPEGSPMLSGKATAVIDIPSKLLDVRDNVVHSGITYPRDTLFLSFDDISLSDTLVALKSLVLSADIYYDDIRIIDFNLAADTNFYIVKKDGSITVDDFCPGRKDLKINYSSLPLSVNLSPNPASDFIDMNLFLVEDGFYRFELIDQRGALVSVLAEREMLHGRAHLHFNLDALAAGTYFVRINTPSEVKSSKVVIVK